MNTNPEKFLPIITPETKHFWDGTKQHEIRLQQCVDCGIIYFPPRPFCPQCSSRSINLVVSSGKAKLYSYVISHLPAPGFTPPFSIAVVELNEGPRMMTNIVDCNQTPEALILDMPLVVVYEMRSDSITVPLFKPDKEFV